MFPSPLYCHNNFSIYDSDWLKAEKGQNNSKIQAKSKLLASISVNILLKLLIPKLFTTC